MPMRIVTSRGTNVMSKLNPQNERIKRDYLRYLKNARGKSEATLDAVRKALSRFEDYTGARDLKTFRREQAIGFKERLAETNRQGTGETLSLATQSVTVAALKEFFTWLAWQPGFKSRIHVPDIDYFSLSMKDRATAKAKKLRDFPSLRNGPFGRDVVQAPGGASGLSHDETRCAAFAGAGASSASATCRFRESIPHPVQPRPTAVYASYSALPRRPQDSLPSRLLGFERTRLALSSSFQLASRTSHPALPGSDPH